MEPISIPKLLTEKEAAELLNVAPATLSRWRYSRERDIPFLKLGSGRTSAIRYRLQDLLAFIDQAAIEGRKPRGRKGRAKPHVSKAELAEAAR